MPGPVLTRRALLGLTGAAALGACGGGSRVDAEPVVPSGPRTAGDVVPELEVLSRTREGLVERWTLQSSAVPRPVAVNVLLPSSYDTASRRRYPVVLLLHGSTGDAGSWFLVDLLRTAAGREAIFVMPDGGAQGWYVDWVQQDPPVRWESVHVQAMLPAVDDVYRTIARREGRAVCGISMGGFGAVHYAPAYPEVFAAATAFSGAVSLRTPRDFAALDARKIDDKAPYAIFGRDGADRRVAQVDPVEHADHLVGQRVRLYCGDGSTASAVDRGEVLMLGGNRILLDRARAAGVDIALDVRPGGHDPATWTPAFAAELPRLLAALAPAA